jgi:hypothetical protein
MSRKRQSRRSDYIPMRMEQLKVERDNPHNSAIDAEWYNRIIQELDWALMMEGDTDQTNCFMEKEEQ